MPEAGYTRLDQLLHRLALSHPRIAEASFELDQTWFAHDVERATKGHHVFVAGLARAGTTILMRQLHASGEFRSLTYRDMPFVLAPRLWARISGLSRKDIAAVERAHGDRIQVDADSPESFDEVFWRVFDGRAYIAANALVPHAPADPLLDRFRAYVAAILDTGEPPRRRYLSKNNNNVLRLDAIARAFPNATLLLPFRAPLSHAASLLQQHLHFCDLQVSDPFARSYMDWLAHHEFGPGHRPFVLHARERTQRAPDTLEYWLAAWIETYRWLLDKAPPAARLVCYEDLCEDVSLWPRICALVGVQTPAGAHPFQQRTRERVSIRDAQLSSSAHELYAALRDRAQKCLPP